MNLNDAFINLDDTISIYKIAAYPRFPANDPRYISSEMRMCLARAAFVQMQKTMAENLRSMAAYEKRKQEGDPSSD